MFSARPGLCWPSPKPLPLNDEPQDLLLILTWPSSWVTSLSFFNSLRPQDCTITQPSQNKSSLPPLPSPTLLVCALLVSGCQSWIKGQWHTLELLPLPLSGIMMPQPGSKLLPPEQWFSVLVDIRISCRSYKITDYWNSPVSHLVGMEWVPKNLHSCQFLAMLMLLAKDPILRTNALEDLQYLKQASSVQPARGRRREAGNSLNKMYRKAHILRSQVWSQTKLHWNCSHTVYELHVDWQFA